MLQPPTDNLYKFMAISGLIILIASIGFLWKKYEEYDHEVILLTNQALLTKVQLNIFSEQLEHLEKSAAQLKKSSNETIPNEKFSEFKNELMGPATKMKNNIEELLQKDMNAAREVSYRKKWLNIYGWAAMLLTLSGLALSINGFVFWYFRVQKHLDKQIKPTRKILYINKKT